MDFLIYLLALPRFFHLLLQKAYCYEKRDILVKTEKRFDRSNYVYYNKKNNYVKQKIV